MAYVWQLNDAQLIQKKLLNFNVFFDDIKYAFEWQMMIRTQFLHRDYMDFQVKYGRMHEKNILGWSLLLLGLGKSPLSKF